MTNHIPPNNMPKKIRRKRYRKSGQSSSIRRGSSRRDGLRSRGQLGLFGPFTPDDRPMVDVEHQAMIPPGIVLTEEFLAGQPAHRGKGGLIAQNIQHGSGHVGGIAGVEQRPSGRAGSAPSSIPD